MRWRRNLAISVKRVGLSGRVPRRVDAATKAGLVHLLDEAVNEGWPLRRACHELDDRRQQRRYGSGAGAVVLHPVDALNQPARPAMPR